MFKFMKNKVLVIVAHPDDEILGVGGTILKHVASGDEVSVCVLGDGELSREGATLSDVEKRKQQINRVAKELGLTDLFIEDFSDNRFDSVELLDIVKKIEIIINSVHPNIIYTHHAHDLNIDHRLTCQAVLTACRPQPGLSVSKILAFETLSSTEWQIKDCSMIFCPNEYNVIDEYIEKKIKILSIYKDEVKNWPHPRSLEGVKILAQYRGMEVGHNYVEAFQVIRSIK